jgi:IclR family transcriptional regulator, blcABC operon repressor
LRDFCELCRRSAHISRETARVAVLDGLDVLYLARYDGTQPLRLTANIGDRFPANCTATGKAILSTLDPAVAEDRLRGRALPALSERSLTSVSALLEDLAATRERGYAIDDEEATAGIVCLAVPVMGLHTGSTPFAISVTVLKMRLDEQFREALLKDLGAIAAGMENPMLPQGVSTGDGGDGAGLFPGGGAPPGTAVDGACIFLCGRRNSRVIIVGERIDQHAVASSEFWSSRWSVPRPTPEPRRSP